MEIFLLIVFIILIVISYCYWRFNKNSKWIDQQTLLPIQTFVEMADSWVSSAEVAAAAAG